LQNLQNKFAKHIKNFSKVIRQASTACADIKCCVMAWVYICRKIVTEHMQTLYNE